MGIFEVLTDIGDQANDFLGIETVFVVNLFQLQLQSVGVDTGVSLCFRFAGPVQIAIDPANPAQIFTNGFVDMLLVYLKLEKELREIGSQRIFLLSEFRADLFRFSASSSTRNSPQVFSMRSWVLRDRSSSVGRAWK